MKLKEIFSSISPPPQWRVPVITALGVIFGLGFVIAHMANATSYLSNDPKACINCHVMTAQYISWEKSSHARVATCNDCHVPQDNFFRTYMFKASDGMRHATMFTFRLEPEVIRIKEAGINVVQENCMRCHQDYIHNVALMRPVTLDSRAVGNGKFCWDCHRETPHGTVRSLSSFPDARVPQLNPIMPKWLDEFTSDKK